jgi:hypothetical protein
MTVELILPIAPRRSEFFNARYAGWCGYHDCYKRGSIEQGDGCEYHWGDLMHMRCARAAEREEEWDGVPGSEEDLIYRERFHRGFP